MKYRALLMLARGGGTLCLVIGVKKSDEREEAHIGRSDQRLSSIQHEGAAASSSRS